MAAEFRCERCGRMLDVEGEPGGLIECPHCSKSATVPAALASLPRPHVPPNGRMARELAAGPDQEAASRQEQLIQSGRDDAVMAVMARVMPWVVSLFLHVSIALIMAFIVMLAVKEIPDPVGVTLSGLSENPVGTLNPRDRPPKVLRDRQRGAGRKLPKRGSTIIIDPGKTDRKIRLYAPYARDGRPSPGVPYGPGRPHSPAPPFFGIGPGGENINHIVWVIDRSGSMMDSFELVKRAMFTSISELKAIQDFHVILFSDGPPVEGGARRLVPATEQAKLKAVRFLADKRALRQTDPVPALRRAFAVLKMADRGRKGKLIHLLTDGVFPDNAAVLETIRKLNSHKEVKINTYLYGNRPPVAVAVMKKIKDENGGQYKYISGGE